MRCLLYPKFTIESLCLGCITGTGTEVRRSAVEPKEAKITNAQERLSDGINCVPCSVVRIGQTVCLIAGTIIDSDDHK